MLPGLRPFTIHTAAVIAERFRHRVVEWYLAGATTAGGIILLRPGQTFDLPPYAGMHTIATEETWGQWFLLIGIARLVVLAINGAWRGGTSFLRAVLAVMCAFFWLALLFGHMSMDTPTVGAALLGGAFVVEFVVVYRASGDTRTASNGNGGGNGKSG